MADARHLAGLSDGALGEDSYLMGISRYARMVSNIGHENPLPDDVLLARRE